MYQLWHNPKCSKSREALSYLQSQSVRFEVFLYLESTPTVQTILAVQQKLGLPITAMIRSKEALFKELGLSLKDQCSDEAWAEILAQNPKLIECPILVSETKAAIGRPLENIQAMV